MYRLKFRGSWIGFAALLLGAGLIAFMQKLSLFQGNSFIFDLPIYYVAPAQILIPFFFAVIHFRTCPFVQQLSAFLTTLAFVCLLGIIGNLTATQIVLIEQTLDLHISLTQSAIINIAAIIAAVRLMHAEQMSSFADTKVAEAQLERLKQAKVDPETQAKWEKAASHAERQADGRSLRSTMTNLKAINLSDPNQELRPQAQQIQQPKPKAAPAESDGSLASLLDRIGDEPAPVQGEELELPELKAGDAAGEKAKKEVTFADVVPETKSAPASFEELVPKNLEVPKPELPSDSFLSSFLDREESMAQGGAQATVPSAKADAETSLDNLFKEPAQAQAPESKAASLPMGNFRTTSQSTKGSPVEPVPTANVSTPVAPVQPAAPAEPPPAPAEEKPSNTAARLQAMKRRNTSTFTKLQSLSASGPGSLTSPLDDVKAEPDGLRSLLDRLDDEKPVEQKAPAEPFTAPVELLLDSLFKDGAVYTPEVEEKVAEAPAGEESEAEKTEARRSSVSERLAEEARAAEPEAAATAETISKEEPVAQEAVVAEAVVQEPVLKEEAVVEEPVPSEVSVVEETVLQVEEVSAQETVLQEEAAVEEAALTESAPVEEILPLTPPEDITGEQPAIELEEVLPEAEPEAPAEQEEVVEEEEEESAPLFEGGVDGDIDDIFSTLAPPEAQLEVRDLLKEAPTAPVPSEPAPEATPAAVEEVEPEEEEEEAAPLFEGGVDSDIDDIFSILAPPEAQKEVKDLPKAAAPVQAKAPVATDTEEEAEQETGLFDEHLGEELDNIFSGLTETEQKDVSAETLSKVKVEITEPAAPAAKVEAKAPEVKAAEAKAPPQEAPKAPEKKAEPAAPAAPKYKEVKEFGRLSSRSAATPRAGEGESVGTMKTIGKLLLDVHAVENIIKAGENKTIGSKMSTAKVISAQRGEGIKNILSAIDTYEGVSGSLIVGHDGLVIASTVGTGWDKDMLGALSTALLSTSNLATKKLEIGKLRQMVLFTDLEGPNGHIFKTSVLTDVDVGILAVFIEETDITKIDGLLQTIHTTIHGG